MNIAPELVVFFSSMLPITELRISIPLGFAMGLPPLVTATWALLGNIIPCLFILWVLPPIARFLMLKSTFFNKFFTKLFDKTKNKHEDAIIKYGPIFLIVFVAIPLPGSGGWTGSLIAFLFGIRYLKAIIYIVLGLLIADIIVTLSAMGIISLF